MLVAYALGSVVAQRRRQSKAGAAEEARYLWKEDEFLLLVQTAIQAAIQSVIANPRFGHSDKIDRTQMLAPLPSDAVTVAGRLPPTMTAIDAAHDFIAYALDEGPT